jgi:flavin-binding protein dodecin
MSEHVYRKTEVVGSSTSGIDAAIANAVSKASETIRNLEWFEVAEIRGHIENGAVAHTQVTLKIGFRME